MWRLSLAFCVMLFFTGCGKNDIGVIGPNYPYPGTGPITQAPFYPSQPPYQNPPYPNQPPYGPAFYPQMPPSMPPQFYPFLPIYNYFYQQPQLNIVWVQIWTQWQIYATNCGCGLYNFPVFWQQYFPQMWSYGNYVPFYQYMNSYFYPWMSAGINLPYVAEPSFFWMNYSGFPLCGYTNFPFSGW